MQLEAEIEWTESCTWRPWSVEFGDALGGRDRSSLEMHLEAVIRRVWRCTWRLRSSKLRAALGGRDRVWRCTWRPRSSELRAALGDRDRGSLEMHLEAEIEWTESCTWRRWSIEFGDALGSRDRASLEMHWGEVIERVWRCTCRPWLSEFGDALVAGYDRARLEEYLAVVDLEAVGGRRARCWDSIHRLVNSKPWACDKVTSPLKLLWRPRSSELRAALRGQDRASLEMHLEAVDLEGGTPEAEATFRGQLEIVRMKGRQTILGVCCTRC